MKVNDPSTVDRIRGCLWGLYIGDALAMPCHWYYNPDDIKEQFGKITNYEAPKERQHQHSFMSASGTGSHMVDGKEVFVIGDVINHGKREFWGVKNMHYHQGMAAGDNTLNLLCARLAMRTITSSGGRYDPAEWLKAYVKFMTTPGSHNDTYAEAIHRDFFMNYSKGSPPGQCAKVIEGQGHIGSFVTLPPVVVCTMSQGPEAVTEAALSHLHTQHGGHALDADCSKYSSMLLSLLSGEAAVDVVAKAGFADKVDATADDLDTTYKTFGPSCNLPVSMPLTAHFLNKYGDKFEEGVLANVNVGGENCHRGGAIGCLLGASVGEAGIPAWLIEGLTASADIKQEIDAFVDAMVSISQ